MVRLDVTENLSGISTTQAVVTALPALSGYNLKKMLRGGDIRLNGARIRKDYETAVGDIIEVYLPEELQGAPELDVVYEDRNILKNPASSGFMRTCLLLQRNMYFPWNLK